MSEEPQPKPRFTGIFIPVEVLEIEDLTPLEQILLSWIDALYDKEKGGCFASNQYLAQRLKVKENTIAKCMVNLRKKNLIEDISFDGRKRVVKSLVHKYVHESQSKAGLEKNPTQTVKKIQPSHYIESKDERKEEESAPDVAIPFPFSSLPKELSQSLLKNIRCMLPSFKEPNLKEWELQIDRMIRIDNRTPEEIKKIIDWLPHDEFWSTVVLSPANLRKNYDKLCIAYNANGKKTNTFNPEQYVRKIFKSGEIYSNYECNINSLGISFTSVLGQSHMQIAFKENGFLEQFENMCRKLKITIKENS